MSRSVARLPTGGHDPDASNRPRAMFPPRHRSPEDERPKAVGACPQRLSRLDRIEPRAPRELPDERVLCNATCAKSVTTSRRLELDRRRPVDVNTPDDLRRLG
jgi:hypothetical protein